jgi:hypothetical protein
MSKKCRLEIKIDHLKDVQDGDCDQRLVENVHGQDRQSSGPHGCLLVHESQRESSPALVLLQRDRHVDASRPAKSGPQRQRRPASSRPGKEGLGRGERADSDDQGRRPHRDPARLAHLPRRVRPRETRRQDHRRFAPTKMIAKIGQIFSCVFFFFLIFFA